MIKNLLLLLAICASMNLFAQTHDGDVRLTTQKEVNDFGAKNYTIINGSLQIEGGNAESASLVTDLSPLNSIKEINGGGDDKNGLFISSLYGVTGTLEGFENLEKIVGEFRLSLDENESQITKVNFCNKLKSVSGLFDISTEETLEEITGFDALTEVGGDFRVFGNKKLKTLAGFNNLKAIQDDLSLTDMPELTTIDAFANIEAIGENLSIYDNPKLVSISTFDKLQTLGSGVLITNNPLLIEILGFEALTSLGDSDKYGSINIGENEALTTIDAFQNVQQVASFAVANNPNLETLSALNKITDATKTVETEVESIHYTLGVIGCPKIKKIDAFKSLKKCHNIAISDIPLIENLNFLCALEEVAPIAGSAGSVAILGTNITDCYALCGIPALERYEIAIVGKSNECLNSFNLIQACGSNSDNCSATSTHSEGTTSLRIFPNPARDRITIKGASSSAVHVYTIDGRHIRSYNDVHKVEEIDISSYDAGMYIFHITEETSGSIMKTKVVKM